MKKLHEIIKEKNQLQKDLETLRESFSKHEKTLITKIKDLKRIQILATSIESALDIEKIQMAESVLEIGGDPVGKNLNIRAINKISNDPEYLHRNFLGNKRYEAFYQECNCEYGYGPRHGSIVDRIGLKSSARSNGLSDEEKDACIYYLTNIKKIKKLENEASLS